MTPQEGQPDVDAGQDREFVRAKFFIRDNFLQLSQQSSQVREGKGRGGETPSTTTTILPPGILYHIPTNMAGTRLVMGLS